MSFKGTNGINKYSSFIIALTCALVVSCATHSIQYKLLTYSKNGEVSSTGIIYLPSRLEDQYKGECKWKENNLKITPCYVEISNSKIYIDLDPYVDDANRILSGNIEHNSAQGINEYHSFGGIQRKGTFELSNKQ